MTSAVAMVDVIRSQHLPKQLLKQEQILIRQPRAGQPSQRAGAGRGADQRQLIGDELQRLIPCHRNKLAIQVAYQRGAQALRMSK